MYNSGSWKSAIQWHWGLLSSTGDMKAVTVLISDYPGGAREQHIVLGMMLNGTLHDEKQGLTVALPNIVGIIIWWHGCFKIEHVEYHHVGERPSRLILLILSHWNPQREQMGKIMLTMQGLVFKRLPLSHSDLFIAIWSKLCWCNGFRLMWSVQILAD